MRIVWMLTWVACTRAEGQATETSDVGDSTGGESGSDAEVTDSGSDSEPPSDAYPPPDFVAEAGIRLDDAAIPEAGIDAETGAVWLYFLDKTVEQPRRSVSGDGLSFGERSAYTDRANDPRRVLMPNGQTWRLYEWDPSSAELHSFVSSDGSSFSEEEGVRYEPQPADNGTFGIYELYSLGEQVTLLYLGDLYGLNNTRRATSQDGGLTFTFQNGNVLGDDDAGGGPNTYVDITTLLLPDGRRRLFAMKGGQAIHSFVSADGETFTYEGVRVSKEAWTEYDFVGIYDPSIVALPDGGYRIYVCGGIVEGDQTHEMIVSGYAAPPEG